jgi:hypothetical protein
MVIFRPFGLSQTVVDFQRVCAQPGTDLMVGSVLANDNVRRNKNPMRRPSADECRSHAAAENFAARWASPLVRRS